MKALSFLSVSVLLWLGCSHSRFVLHDAAREGSEKDSQRVEVSSRDRLSIFYRADGETQSIPEVNAVAAEGQHLLVSSEDWKTVRQVPRRYHSMSGIRVRSPSSDYDEPTVALPVSSIEEIRIEERELQWPPVMERIGRVPRWFIQGAIGGFLAGGLFAISEVFLSDSPDPSHEGSRTLDRDDWEVAGAVAVLFGAGGAVLFPAGRLLWPESRKTWRSYRSRGQGFRLEFGDSGAGATGAGVPKGLGADVPGG
ncbi:MAG: hypothetical protein OXG13_19600 [Gemmatimonadaceae bacterium]|nr:hypothetical protein [Gemmatimonadaceae bacterium]